MTKKPPEAGLFVGYTAHARPDGKSRFRYRLFSVFLDIDNLVSAAGSLAINKPGLLSFYERDHGDRTGRHLRDWAEDAFRAGGIELAGGGIRLLTMPRVFGFVFNPISIFLGYGPDGALRGVIYEVNNTFGETHSYVAAAGAPNAEQRHRAPKAFHVSPFFAVDGEYEFQLHAPVDTFGLTITKRGRGKPDHVAVWNAVRRPLSRGALLKAWVGSPILTFWVVGTIHWQALKLWMRGARYHRRPEAPQSAITVATPVLD